MYPQVRSVETPAERNLRIVREQDSLYPETVIALLQPFEQQTAAGMMPFANMGGETVPLASAVRRLRDENPALAGLFQGGGKLDVRALTPTQYRAIRETNARELVGLRPKP